ncbi:uncharacterized protein [Haliotis asinina]|uniref:uncharacterized protein n=1 Tax=Haliotis asinina TaxID=109174 RepID=UPI003531D5D7
MATIKKALRMSIRGKRYSVLDGTQTDYFSTPKYAKRRNSDGDSPNSDDRGEVRLPRRGSKVTQSVRDAVGNIRQKFRMSTRRKMRLKEKKGLSPRTPTRAGKRTVGKTPPYRNTKIYSPFYIETPKELVKAPRNGPRMGKGQMVETPTRLRREVEALTANMQALAALTPTTLRDRAKTRRPASPITNGSLKVRTQARRRIETTVY